MNIELIGKINKYVLKQNRYRVRRNFI